MDSPNPSQSDDRNIGAPQPSDQSQNKNADGNKKEVGTLDPRLSLTSFPLEILFLIVEYVKDVRELITLGKCCKLLKTISSDDRFWQQKFLQRFEYTKRIMNSRKPRGDSNSNQNSNNSNNNGNNNNNNSEQKIPTWKQIYLLALQSS